MRHSTDIRVTSQNSKSAIYPTPEASHGIEAVTPDVLDCQTDRTFWLSWKRGHLKVGYGSIVHSHGFLGWTDPGHHPISSVGFMRNDAGVTVWTLNELDGKITVWQMQTHLNLKEVFGWYVFVGVNRRVLLHYNPGLVLTLRTPNVHATYLTQYSKLLLSS